MVVKWNALPFEKKCTCWREHSIQRDAKVISGESFNVSEHVLFEGFGSTMSRSNSVAQTHSLCMFWHSLLAYFDHRMVRGGGVGRRQVLRKWL